MALNGQPSAGQGVISGSNQSQRQMGDHAMSEPHGTLDRMTAHLFNIGLPNTSKWWQQNLQRGVITTGYGNQPDGRGKDVLMAMEEGDTILAYCNDRGYVGFGLVGSASSYRLHSTLPKGSFSDHQHERAVQWRYFVQDVDDAVSLAQAKAPHPQHARQRLDDEEAVQRIIRLLRDQDEEFLRSRGRTPAKYWHVADAVIALGAPSTRQKIVDWITNHHPSENTSDVLENAVMFSVNDANRVHYDKQLLNLRSDAGHPKNLLFKTGAGQSTRFEPYEPARHGIWIIEAGPGKPKFLAWELPSSTVERATAQARQAEAQAQALEDMPDERTRVLRLVVLREGRKEFRDGLIQAYGGRCAISGCTVIDILEAAHIHPYRGPRTDETSNGLLLRADIHTLFDKGLLWIDDDYTVRTSTRLQGSEYQAFDGTRLLDTHQGLHRPNTAHLRNHRTWATSATSPSPRQV